MSATPTAAAPVRDVAQRPAEHTPLTDEEVTAHLGRDTHLGS
ncbi:hypothetical protein ACFWBB_03790 [Streptomyces sp. NPDC060000]